MRKPVTFRRSYHHATAYTKWFSIGVDEFTHLPRWAWERNRTQGRTLRVPLVLKWTLEFSTAGKTYLELVNAPSELKDIDWIIDEFDANFNALAVASLRYHMDHSVALCTDDKREKYTELIARLTEKEPKMFNDDEGHLREHLHSSNLSELFGTDTRNPEMDAVFERYREREKAYLERVQQARHDFVDIMPELWS